MNEMLSRLTALSPQKLALYAAKLQQRVNELEAARHEPIAIIGAACRFPGAADPQALWELLLRGGDAIEPIPSSRWDVDAFYDEDPATPGKMSARHGGFLPDVDGFDAAFFGISPREARSMDPQQRLLLEVAWECLENAGVAPDRVADTRTGVFVGVSPPDYTRLLVGPQTDLADLDPHFASGNAPSVAAGRLSYVLGLRGPCVALDTACSSSLVAVHLACQSLRGGEAELAIAGGVNLILSPAGHVALSRAGMLARDGRCKTFDARADGFVRSEGCGLVLLRRLSDALAAGDSVIAVIRGSAVNQDGRSTSLTAPNGPSQEAVLAAALADARAAPSEIGFVETHGTGTALGDPIEVQALARALGQGRPADKPLLIGALKPNLGHMESAAGIGGLIKLALSLQQRTIPPNIHIDTLNPHIAWQGSPVAIVRHATPWPDGRALGGVSSFGFSGTNAHVVLGPPPVSEKAPARSERPLHLLALSARTEEALRQVARRYAGHLASHPGDGLADVAHAANVGRAAMAHRAVVLCADRDEARGALAALAEGRGDAAVAQARAPASQPRVAFLFTGQGAQYRGMGRGLYDGEPRFRAAIERADAVLADEQGWGFSRRPLSDLLYGDAAGLPDLDQTLYAQPALFAIGCALAELWQSWGVRPDAVMGHSLGEYVAACVAGVFDVEAGLRLLAARGRLMQALPGDGAMVEVAAPANVIAAAVAPHGAQVAVAADNGPRQQVISGARRAVEAVAGELRRAGHRTRTLAVSQAFHSPLVEPMVDAFRQELEGVALKPARLPLMSNLTGEWAEPAALAGVDYWCRHLRAPVRFETGVSRLRAAGFGLGIEVGPHPHLLPIVQDDAAGDSITWLHSLRQGRDDWRGMLGALRDCWLAGAPTDWEGLDRPCRRKRIRLPTYPFEHRRHWLPAPRTTRRASRHPLLGERRDGPLATAQFAGLVSEREPAFMADHKVAGAVTLPGAAVVDAALAAAREIAPETSFALDDLVLRTPVVVASGGELATEVTLDRNGDGFGFRLYARDTKALEAPWTLHAEARLAALTEAAPAPIDVGVLKSRCPVDIDVGAFYGRLADAGVALGPTFRLIEQAHAGDAEAIAWLRAPAADDNGHRMHPAIIDAALQALGIAANAREAGPPRLPFSIGRVTLHNAATGPLVAWGRVAARGGAEPEGSVTLAAADGAIVALIDAVRFRALARAGVPAEWLYELTQEPADIDAPLPDVLPLRRTPAALADSAKDAELADYIAFVYALEPLARAYASAAVASRPHARGETQARLLTRLESLAGGVEHADPDAMIDALRAAHPRFAAEIDLVGRCGPRIAQVVTGKVDPLQLLFPAGSQSTAQRIYRDAPLARAINAALATALDELAGALPVGRRLRILEVGAGTGGTTSHVLRMLPADRVDYLFTDISSTLVAAAEQSFASYGSIAFRIFDLERDAASQGLQAESFDVVIAANVLHATADLRAVLASLRGLLTPGGVLLAIESTQPRAAADVTFGLTDGWWRFRDRDLRPAHPLLARPQWRELLAREGYVEIETLPDAGAHGRDGLPLFADQVILRARRRGRSLSGTWAILADGREVADAVAADLEGRGARVVRVASADAFRRQSAGRFEVDPNSEADYRALLSALAAEGELAGLLHLWPLARAEAALPATSETGGWRELLSLTNALLASNLEQLPRLISAVGGAPASRADVDAGLLRGIHRVLRREHPELVARLVHLDDVTTAAECLIGEILADDRELEVSWSGSTRSAARLRRRAGAMSRRLAISERGSFDGLAFEPQQRVAPGPGEVEIEVSAAALNFRDVLNVLGLYPGELGPPGEECVGTIARVGDGVREFAPGDAVIAITGGSLASYVIAPAAFVRRKPAVLDDVAAATLPVAYLTAGVALELLGQVRAGQRVLIHAAAGGVGLAAVHLAIAAGAEVFATASPAKWATLRAIGVRHVMSSRSPDFAAEVKRLTDGAGVDLVLNSLSDAFIPASLDLVRPGGAFLEIGRRDIWPRERVAALRPDIAYHPIVVAEEAARDPTAVACVLDDMLARVARGTLPPLPAEPVAFDDAPAALRRMAQGGHIGKIVVRVGRPPSPPIGADGAYLITGAFGGIGPALASWLAGKGARSLVLVGRRAPDAAATAQIDRLRAEGIAIRIETRDVGDAEAMTALFGSLPPRSLRGIFHAAGTLDDAVLVRQSAERFRDVLRAKVDGAWLLDRLSDDHPIEHFVLFGAGAALFGTPGQANHAAANAGLETFARYRHAQGKPALCVDWGPWADVGAAARHTRRGSAEQQGMGLIAPAQGFAALDALMAEGAVHAAVLPLDWPTYLARHDDGEIPRLLASLAATARAARVPGKAKAPPAPAKDATAAPIEEPGTLSAFLRSELARLLALAPDQAIDPDRPLQEYGVDSLLAVELRNLLARRLARNLPATLLFDFPTINRLVAFLSPAPTAPAAPVVQLAAPASSDGIAIIGLGCRLPGGITDGESYWRLLIEGRDGIAPIATDRWVHADARLATLGGRERSAVTRGGFLENVDQFDARFFGISPLEARQMDPQQRLLLETTWQALEHAGLRPDALAGTRGGVFVGIAGSEYAHLLLRAADDDAAGLHLTTGNSASVAAGRIAYLLGLTGPAMAVDTACSSSLVAVHLACRSLLGGECDVALAGGVNVIVGPEIAIGFARSGALAADGRCKAFAADADGYGRGEGCGVVALKRLADAERDGDRVLAVIRGSAVNQDGRSAGLTAPNGPSQEAVIGAALAGAKIAPADIGYVEAHGTGTVLGDPIEARAIAGALRPAGINARPLLIGSVKSNLGHLEAAAGVASLIKAVLIAQRRIVPASLHCGALNPHIPWSDLSIDVARHAQPLPEGAKVGVSSFGFSGTNAHVVIDAGTAAASPSREMPGPAALLPLSARSPEALADLARRWAELLREPAPLIDLLHTAALRRTHYEHRLAVAGRDATGLAGSLTAWLAEGSDRRVAVAQASPDRRPRIAFVFSGLGGQWPRMALDLIDGLPEFRAAWERCEAALAPHLPEPATALLRRLDRDEDFEDITVAQFLLFAVQVGLAAQWRAWGIEPQAVVGHSMGEIAAAHVAGALSLADAATVMAARIGVLARIEGDGGMLAVDAAEGEIADAIADLSERVSIAAINGHRSIVLTGERAALETVAQRLAARNLFHRWVRIRAAAHSPRIDPHLADFRRAIETIMPGAPSIPLYSTALSRWLGDMPMDAAYWAANLRQPVRFAGAIDALAAGGHDAFVEISAHPVLGTAIEAELDRRGARGQVIASLRRDADGPVMLAAALGALHAMGHAVDWRRLGYGEGRVVDLPFYPWQRQRFWPMLAAEPARTQDDIADLIYAAEWRREDPHASLARAAGAWVVLGGRGGVGPALAGLLRRQGADVRLADAITPADIAAMNKAKPLRGIVDLRPLDLPDLSFDALAAAPGATLGVEATLTLLQAIATAGTTRVWVATAGAQAVGTSPVRPATAPVIGLGIVAALELPMLWGGTCDLDPASGAAEMAQQLLGELLGGGEDDEVAYRDGIRHVPRLKRAPPPAGRPAFDPHATCLITGGLGGIGLALARWLVEGGARRLLLVGRRPPDARQRAAIIAIEALGARVETRALDVATPGALSALFDEMDKADAPIRTVIHAAGVTHPARLLDLDPATVDDVMRAKVAGAWALHDATRGRPLDCFLMLSSGAALWGGEGQAPYAAANRFLDALAHARRRQGLAATAVDLGWWADSGMITGEAERYYESIGVRSFTAAEGCAAIGRVLASGLPSAAVARFDWQSFGAVMQARRPRPLIAELADGARPAAATDPMATSSDAAQELSALDPITRRRRLAELAAEHVAAVMGFESAAALDRDTGFFQLGMDSVMAVRLRGRLEKAFGRKLPTTLAFEHPTVPALAAFLDGLFEPQPSAPIEPPSASGADALIAALDELSDEEVERRLARRGSAA